MLVDDPIGQQYETLADEARPAYAAAFTAMLDSERDQMIVAVHDGTVAGMLQITYSPGLNRRGSWRATIESVRVRSDARSQGIGRMLMEEAISRARQRGCGIVQLTAHRNRANAHRFYESLGFTPSHVGMKLPLLS